MRLEGWENPYLTQWHGKIPCDDGCDVEVYEAGADAMLGGLRKHPFPVGHLVNSVFLTCLPYDATLITYEGKKGCLVFIEEVE